MHFKIFLTILVSLPLIFGQQVCPPAGSLSPCSCNEDEKTIVCSGVRGPFNIKASFDNASPFIDDSTIFDKLYIYDCSSLQEIPDGTFSSYKFLEIDFSYNENLYLVSPNAFNATYKVTTNFDLWANHYLDEGVFDVIKNFVALEQLWITSGRFTTIPSGVFNSPSLNYLYLKGMINSLPERAFASLPLLENLNLAFANFQDPNTTHPLAFEGISSLVDVDLTYSGMTYFDEVPYKMLMDSAKVVEIGGSSCGPNGCRYQYLDCDERANWVCENRELYEWKLHGFRCREAGVEDVWEYCTTLKKSG